MQTFLTAIFAAYKAVFISFIFLNRYFCFSCLIKCCLLFLADCSSGCVIYVYEHCRNLHQLPIRQSPAPSLSGDQEMRGSQAETRDRKPATGMAARRNMPGFVLADIDNWTRAGFCRLVGSSAVPPDLCRLSELYAVTVLVCMELMWHLKDFP